MKGPKLLSREEAEQYGTISGAQVGADFLSGGRKFADEFFDSRKGLYEPEELTDLLRTRYLVRKIKDVPPYVPPLDEVRSDVSLACKMIAARVLAEKAASELAEQLKKKGGTIKETIVDGYRVLTIPPISRKQSRVVPSDYSTFGETPEDKPHPGRTLCRRRVSRRFLRSPARLDRHCRQPTADDLLRDGARQTRAGNFHRLLCPVWRCSKVMTRPPRSRPAASSPKNG